MSALVLVAQADPDLAATLSSGLAEAGYESQHVTSADETIDFVGWRQPALVLLDTTLVAGNGLDVCRSVRTASQVPIILLSDRVEAIDRIIGFELGADDYIDKPFDLREVICRVRAVLRRTFLLPENDPARTRPICFGQVKLDPVRGLVTRRGTPVQLKPREYQLLHFLTRNPGRVFSDRQIINNVWGPAYRGSGETVKVHIHSLRTKLEDDPGRPQYLRTAHRRGYFFDDEGGSQLPSSRRTFGRSRHYD